MPPYTWSDPVVAAFLVIPVGLAALFIRAVARAYRLDGASPRVARRVTIRTAVGVGTWMAATMAVAETGVLRDWARTPPPFAFFLLTMLVLAVGIAFGPLGRRLAVHLPLWSLVAVQSFRLPLELAMHGLYVRGIMPVQMSYSGLNFDIVTGILAVVVAAIAARNGRARLVVAAWNSVGSILLINVVTVGVLSTPRIGYFGEDQLNVWVTYPPFVWLPAVMVLTALTGHLVIFRALIPRDRPRS